MQVHNLEGSSEFSISSLVLIPRINYSPYSSLINNYLFKNSTYTAATKMKVLNFYFGATHDCIFRKNDTLSDCELYNQKFHAVMSVSHTCVILVITVTSTTKETVILKKYSYLGQGGFHAIQNLCTRYGGDYPYNGPCSYQACDYGTQPVEIVTG